MSTNLINVESVGHLSARANVPLRLVLEQIAALRVKPAMTIDDVIHLSEADAQRVLQGLVNVSWKRKNTK